MKALKSAHAHQLIGKGNNARCTSAQVNTVRQYQQAEALKSFSEIPGPKSLPFIGPLANFLPGGELYNMTGMKMFDKLHKTYGPILKIDKFLGRPNFISLSDPESVAMVLRGESTTPIRKGLDSLVYYRTKYNKTEEQRKKPSGLLTEHHDRWQNIRTKVNPVLMQPRIMKLYSSTIDEIALESIVRFRSKRNNANMLDGKFDYEINLWALESLGVVALGTRLNCLDPNLPEDSPAKQLVKCVHDVFSVLEEIEFKPNLWNYFSTSLFKKAMKTYEEQERLIKYFVNKAIESYKGEDNKSDCEKSVLEKLLEKDKNIAYAMASDMLFAGVDTTANTLLGILYLLAVNPDKQLKLREELSSEEKDKPYLKACIKEGMRIMPILSANARETTKEYNIMGYRIPSGTGVVFMHHYMSTVPENYPEPEKYIPERWLLKEDNPLSYKNAHPFATQPFGYGPRMCIGRRLAQLELETFLYRFFQNFTLKWKGNPPKINASIINYVMEPYNFVYTDVINK